MTSPTLVLTFVTAATAVSLVQRSYSEIQDFSETDNSRIIHGQPAELGQLPWQAGLERHLPNNMTSLCGGSLIADKWILTAAHCVQATLRFNVYLGSITKLEGTSMETSTMYMHPEYDPRTMENDIGLLELPEAVILNDTINIVRLPNATDYLGANVNVTSSGWGRPSDDPSPPYSDVLQFVTLTTITNEKCKESYVDDQIFPTFLCAVGNPNHGACKGDSGGALVRYDTEGEAIQVGVTSFALNGSHCDSVVPSGYVRTETYLPWFKEITGLDL